MNTIKKVTLFCASIVLCFGFCGCSSDDDENTNSSSNEKKIVKIIKTYEGGEVTTVFNYDNKGRLLTLTEDHGYYVDHNSYIWSDNNDNVKVLNERGDYYELSIVNGLPISGFWNSLNQTLIFTIAVMIMVIMVIFCGIIILFRKLIIVNSFIVEKLVRVIILI